MNQSPHLTRISLFAFYLFISLFIFSSTRPQYYEDYSPRISVYAQCYAITYSDTYNASVPEITIKKAGCV